MDLKGQGRAGPAFSVSGTPSSDSVYGSNLTNTYNLN